MSSQKLFWLLPILFLAACGRSGTGNAYEKNSAPALAATIMATDSTAINMENKSLNSPERKVIHTADFHCKVQNVFTATTQLERLVKSVGGIVQESNMDNTNDGIKTSYYKPDSLHQTQTYTTTSFLTLRVPSLYLDSVVNAIPAMSGFIDTRTLKQSDVTWTYVANELKNAPGNTKTSTSLALKLAKKSKEPIEVQEYEDGKQDQMINRKIANLQLMDEVSYATLTVAFSQPEQVYIQTVVNPDYFTRPSFTLQCKEALSNGCDLIRGFLVVLLGIWPLMVLVITGFTIAGIITYRRKSNAQHALALK